MFKQVTFYVLIIITIFSLLGGATILQMIPFALAILLAYNHIWNKKNMTVPLIVLAVIMFMINTAGVPSTIDAVVWFTVGAIWAFEK